MDAYSVQFTTLARAVTMGSVALICIRFWRAFTRDEDIREVEAQNEVRRTHRAVRRRLRQSGR